VSSGPEGSPPAATPQAARERFAAIGEIAAEIAHELRNVLQIISANAYLAQKDPAGSLPLIVKIEKNARLAHSIVDDLMALARGEAMHAEPVLVAEVLVASRSDFEAETAAWEDAIEPVDLRARVHPGLVSRLLHVLYENAIAASAPRAPHIATRVWSESGRVLVEVSDDGPGVPADIAARIFDPLVTGRPGGTGLGLALARRIAAAHGGEIALMNDESPGATFRVSLPS
jgi:signal transduction histidine kinase